MTEVAVLDASVIETLRMLTPPGEPDVLAEVLTMFLDEVPPRIDRLRNALTAGNIEEVHRAAHSLKGSAGNIGAQRLFAVCKQFDDKNNAGDPAETARLVTSLGDEYQKVETEIRRLLAK